MEGIIWCSLPEERDEYQLALDAWKWQGALLELKNRIGGLRDHGHQFNTPDEILDVLWDLIVDEMNEMGLRE